MVANLKATGTTNPQPNTCVDAQCSCEIIWSLAQQFAMRQIVTHAPAHNHMPDYREADTHEAALACVMKFLAQLRAAGWKRYIDVGDPRLSARAAWLYGASFPVATYSLDSEYVPNQEEWNAMLRHSPRWIFNADNAYLEVSVMESNMGGFVGKSTYLLTVDVKSEYAFYGLGYFPGNAEKIHNWKALLPAELDKYHTERLKTEAALKAQGYRIDTLYQDPPIMALETSPGDLQ